MAEADNVIKQLQASLQAQHAQFSEQVNQLKKQVEEGQKKVDNRCFKPQNAKEFDGNNKNGNVENWIFQCEQYFTIAGVSAEFGVAYATNGFIGNAATWWRHRLTLNSSWPSWEQFKKELRSRFKPADDAETARDRLAVLTQKGSAMAYTEMFLSLSAQIKDLSDAERKDRYMRGLKSNVHFQVKLGKHTNFDEMVHAALTIDNMLFQSRKEYVQSSKSNTNTSSRPYSSQTNRTTSSSSSSSSGYVPMDLGMAEQETQRDDGDNNNLAGNSEVSVNATAHVKRKPFYVEGLSQEEFRRCREANICFMCKKPGHSARYCKQQQSKNL